ncbi:unnamed protein product [Ophioblennius macclurei]
MYAPKSGTLKDNSWIKKQDSDDDDIDRDPNYGRSILNRRSDDSEDEEETISKSVSTSVQALSDRYGRGPSDVGSSSTTTTYNIGGKSTTTTETTITSVRSSVNKTSSTKTFTERVLSSSKSPTYSPYSPPKITEVTKKAITSTSNAEDHLYDSLVPSSTKGDYSPTDSRKTITTETVTLKSNGELQAENDLYDRLIPDSIKNEASGRKPSSTETVTVRSTTIGGDDDLFDGLRSKSSDYSTITRGENVTVNSSTSIRSYTSYNDDSPISSTTSYSVSTKPGYEYSSSSSPTSYTSTTYRSSSRSDDGLSDPRYSKSSIKNVYSSSDRTLMEKDLCTTCRKPFTGDAKMVLEDINVHCHASCFKCDVCSSTLGNLKAGDSMWVYRGMVHCENCFEVTRAKWRH